MLGRRAGQPGFGVGRSDHTALALGEDTERRELTVTTDRGKVGWGQAGFLEGTFL